jgi:hypothetical protein
MKIHNILIIAIAGSLLSTSCKKVLDKIDRSKGNADLIFGDSALTKQNVDYIYDQSLPTWFGNDAGAIYNASGGVSGLSDESYGNNKFLQGTIATADVGDITTANANNNLWNKMRVINTFIRDLSAGPMAAGPKNRFLAQAYFFRAFRYFNLVRVYGGVPLVLTPLQTVGEENKELALVPRSKTSDCIKQITADLDSAIKYLPVKWPNSADWGRITSGAAAAFKGRVLLTWASPQFNPTNNMQRWQDAYAANTQAVTLLKNGGFGLFQSGGNPYRDMWFTEVNNPEAVMVTGFNNLTDANLLKSNGYDKSVRPTYLGAGSSSTQPSWDFVKLYPMKDGKTPGDATSAYTYSDQTFFKNRDPRFDATIAYNGCNWPILGNNDYRLWTYIFYNGASSTKSTELTGGTTSGFYLRKATNPTVTADVLQFSGTDWMEIRYAEVLLNQAECAAELNKLGASDEPYTNLIAIRKRAGVEAGANSMYGIEAGLSKSGMIDAVMKERAIEFAFEGKRFWDLRRRNMLQPLLNGLKRRVGIIVTLKKDPANYTDYIAATRNSTDLATLYTTSFDITTKQLDTNYDLAWKDNYNFFGVPPATITNNPSILQTNGWDNGGFDPLQ